MEDRGYLVAHPTLIDPKGHAPAEQQHITHKVHTYTLTAQKWENFTRCRFVSVREMGIISNVFIYL